MDNDAILNIEHGGSKEDTKSNIYKVTDHWRKKFYGVINGLKSCPLIKDPSQPETIIARVPIAPNVGAPSTISALDTKTTPNLLPTDSSMGSSDGIFSSTQQDTNCAAAAKDARDHEITAKELDKETKRTMEAGHACIMDKMEDSKLSEVLDQ
jgi:hypothetical protein